MSSAEALEYQCRLTRTCWLPGGATTHSQVEEPLDAQLWRRVENAAGWEALERWRVALRSLDNLPDGVLAAPNFACAGPISRASHRIIMCQYAESFLLVAGYPPADWRVVGALRIHRSVPNSGCRRFMRHGGPAGARGEAPAGWFIRQKSRENRRKRAGKEMK